MRDPAVTRSQAADREPRPAAQNRAAVLELRALGGVEVAVNGVPAAAVLAQPRRLALLLYLALRAPFGFHHRDQLLGIFWPESQSGAARASLRQAVRFLRRSLGNDVIVSHGADGLGIPAEALTCDVVSFRRALEQGADEAALACYRGDLLPGFFVSDAPAFERWLEEERARLRQDAVQAALRLADRAEGDDDAAAAEWARRAHELDPADEAVACRLIALLDRCGNRAAAIAAYDALVRRLGDEYDLAPAPETAALVASIRARADAAGPPATAASAHARTAVDAADATVRAPLLDARRVLVATFENRTGDAAVEMLGRIAADWVAQGLAQVPDLEVVPITGPRSAHAAEGGAEREPDAAGRETGTPSPAAAGMEERTREIARERGAGTAVTGAYYASGDSVTFQPRVIDVDSGRILRAPEPITGARAAPLPAIELLRERLTTVVAPLLSRRSTHVRTSAQPPSYEAYRAYIDGLDRFVAEDWSGALAQFERAAAADAGYLLPRMVAVIAHWNAADVAAADRALREAARLAPSAGPFERAVLDMLRAWLQGDWEAAYAAVRRQAQLAPGSIPHFQVAQEARRLNRPREALAVLSGLEPETGELKGWIFYWLERATALHTLHDHGAELDNALRARTFYPAHPLALLLLLRAHAALGHVSIVDELLEGDVANPRHAHPRHGTLLRETALELRAHGRPAEARALFEANLAWWRERPATERSVPGFERELGIACYDAERWDEADACFRAAQRSGSRAAPASAVHHAHLQGHLDEGYLAVLAVRRGDANEIQRWCDWLESVDRPFLFGSQWLWLAKVEALRGDRVRALRHLRRAFADGLPYESGLHTDVALEPLRDHPPFSALMRPRG